MSLQDMFILQEKCEELEEKLKIATETLKEYRDEEPLDASNRAYVALMKIRAIENEPT